MNWMDTLQTARQAIVVIVCWMMLTSLLRRMMMVFVMRKVMVWLMRTTVLLLKMMLQIPTASGLQTMNFWFKKYIYIMCNFCATL